MFACVCTVNSFYDSRCHPDNMSGFYSDVAYRQTRQADIGTVYRVGRVTKHQDASRRVCGRVIIPLRKELTMGQWVMVKWVNKFGWVTWVTGQYR